MRRFGIIRLFPAGEVAPDGAAELAGSARLPAWFTLRSACAKEGEGEEKVSETAFG